jgi:hypothetical protein
VGGPFVFPPATCFFRLFSFLSAIRGLVAAGGRAGLLAFFSAERISLVVATARWTLRVSAVTDPWPLLSSLAGLIGFIARVLSNELLGYALSPAGLGWSEDAELLLYFWFLHNIRASRSVFL